MTLAGFPRIAIDRAVCGGRAINAETRVRVTDVLEMLAGGASTAEIVADFADLVEADVLAALAYAAAPTGSVLPYQANSAHSPVLPKWQST